MLSKAKRKYLSEIYFNPASPLSYSGINKVWNGIRQDGRVTKSELEEWLREQDSYTSYVGVRRKFRRPQVISPKTNFIWGSDVAYMLAFSKSNDDYSFFVVFIDIFSRYAYAEPLKSLKGRSMLVTMQDVFSQEQPRLLFTDSGTEYVNRNVQNYLKSQDIHHYVSRNEKKIAHAKTLIA